MSSYSTPSPPQYGEPIEPGPPRTAWPMVIGIIVIVFGSLAALGGCFGGIMLMFVPQLAGMVPQNQATDMQWLVQWQPALIGLSLGSMVLGVLGLIGGIGVVRRRAYGMSVSITWAVLKIIFVVPNSIVGYLVNQAQFEAMQNDPNMPALPAAFMQIAGLGGAVFGTLWGWALPIFLLIWFARSTIRQEVRGWSDTRQQTYGSWQP